MSGIFDAGFGLNGLMTRSSFTSRTITAENPTGEKGNGARALPGENSAARELGRGWKVRPSIDIKPGETAILADIRGSGILQSQWYTGYIGRDFILRFYWEDQAHPSVECPLPDFFASAFLNSARGMHAGPFGQLSSLPITVNPNKGLSCFFGMPFTSHCLVTLENCGFEPHTCYYQIQYAQCDVPQDVLYFHAQYRQSRPIPYKGVHTILDGVKGLGHYVGTALSVGLNGTNGWWGEGEVKMYIDGDAEHPSYCGTGLEDYFLGAYDWNVDGTYTTYTTPFAGMHYVFRPDGLYQHQQRFSMYRWHIADPITFTVDLRVTVMALGVRSNHRFLPRQDDYASVAYWYQTLQSAPLFPLPEADLLEVL
jgi:hypothetical protein